MARMYATTTDYRDWSGDDAAELTIRQLISASRLVDLATRGAVFAADSVTGIPTEAAVTDALKEATLEVLLDRHGTEQAKAAAVAKSMRAAGLQEASIGSSRYKLAGAADTTTDTQGLPWEAYLVLLDAGLLAGPVVTYG